MNIASARLRAAALANSSVDVPPRYAPANARVLPMTQPTNIAQAEQITTPPAFSNDKNLPIHDLKLSPPTTAVDNRTMGAVPQVNMTENDRQGRMSEPQHKNPSQRDKQMVNTLLLVAAGVALFWYLKQ